MQSQEEQFVLCIVTERFRGRAMKVVNSRQEAVTWFEHQSNFTREVYRLLVCDFLEMRTEHLIMNDCGSALKIGVPY